MNFNNYPVPAEGFSCIDEILFSIFFNDLPEVDDPRLASPEFEEFCKANIPSDAQLIAEAVARNAQRNQVNTKGAF